MRSASASPSSERTPIFSSRTRRDAGILRFMTSTLTERRLSFNLPALGLTLTWYVEAVKKLTTYSIRPVSKRTRLRNEVVTERLNVVYGDGDDSPSDEVHAPGRAAHDLARAHRAMMHRASCATKEQGHE